MPKQIVFSFCCLGIFPLALTTIGADPERAVPGVASDRTTFSRVRLVITHRVSGNAAPLVLL